MDKVIGLSGMPAAMAEMADLRREVRRLQHLVDQSECGRCYHHAKTGHCRFHSDTETDTRTPSNG